MDNTSFTNILNRQLDELRTLHELADHTQQVELCRTLDAFLLPRVHALHGTRALPQREPLAVTLAELSPGPSRSKECTHCGVHHGRPMDCPQFLPPANA